MKILRKKNGFTLLEVIIVISILAILATLSIMTFKNAYQSSYNTALSADLNTVDKAVQLYINKYDAYPTLSQTPAAATGIAAITGSAAGNLPLSLQTGTSVTVLEIDDSNANFLANVKRTKYLLKGYGANPPTNVRGAGNLYYVSSVAAIASGQAQAGAGTTITLAAGASAVDNYYNDCVIRITGDTGAGQWKRITDYNGTTKVATINGTWTTAPDATSDYDVFPAVEQGQLLFVQKATDDNLKIKDDNGNVIYKY